jgi:hypothetical protein
MAAHIIRSKDPFRATTEFRFQELESFIQITQRACEKVAGREKEILEETISAILKESALENLTDAAAFQMNSVAEYVHTHHDAIPQYLSYTFVIQVYRLFEELAKDLHKELRDGRSIRGSPSYHRVISSVILKNSPRKRASLSTDGQLYMTLET